jgi:hypothetical protein
MTKGELKKEATEYALEWGDKTDGTYACCRDGYLAGAEPREKRIAELEKENTELIQENEEMKKGLGCETCQIHLEFAKLNQKITALKAQIEKMRNFQNCDYQLHIIDCPIFKSGGHISCKKCPHWILQEVSE